MYKIIYIYNIQYIIYKKQETPFNWELTLKYIGILYRYTAYRYINSLVKSTFPFQTSIRSSISSCIGSCSIIHIINISSYCMY